MYIKYISCLYSSISSTSISAPGWLEFCFFYYCLELSLSHSSFSVNVCLTIWVAKWIINSGGGNSVTLHYSQGFYFTSFHLFFWPHHMACRILLPQPGTEPMPPAVEAQGLNNWAAREVLIFCNFKSSPSSPHQLPGKVPRANRMLCDYQQVLRTTGLWQRTYCRIQSDLKFSLKRTMLNQLISWVLNLSLHN